MSKRVQIAAAGLLACVVGVVVWQLAREHEPSYKGKPITFWIREGYWPRSPSSKITPDQAREAVLAVGTNALPFYVKLLQTPTDSAFKQKFHAWQDQHPWMKLNLMGTMAGQRRFTGSCGIGILGPQAKPAFAAITNLLTTADSDQMACATRALVDIGLEGIGPLTNALVTTNAESRCLAVVALGCFASSSLPWEELPKNREQVDQAAKIIVPILLSCLNDPESNVQACAIQSLGLFGREPGAVVPALTERVNNSTNITVRVSAVYVLQIYRVDAVSSVPTLVKCLQDPDPILRSAAADALDEIRGKAAAPSGAK